MELIVVLFFLLCLAGIFAIPVRWKHWFTGLPLLTVGIVTTYAAIPVLQTATTAAWVFSLPLDGMKGLVFYLDPLAAFFVLTVNFTMLTGYLYAGRYMQAYAAAGAAWISVHYLSLLLLYFSMLLVCTQQQAFPFLVGWELMTLSSFLLVIFDAGSRATLKTGINYLVQMHISMFFILAAFLLTFQDFGHFGFTALPAWFSTHREWPIFLLFFIGFGIKAGFFPFHTWLPDAHPAAPSHVSGIMSGIMIKMGIYGIARVLLHLQQDLLPIGIFLLVISLITGIYGVLQAIVQHDLKKLLAYHSIENIGIIGIGLGLGCLGLARGNPWLAMLGFSGGLLHVLNHSLFKSLLFYTAGSVYQATGTRVLDELGGLSKKMPRTAAFFLLGSLAICGLPPFNGFISEYLLYLGMIGSIHGAGLYGSAGLIIALIGLSLIGGLAIFCFTKAFSVVFLGEARSGHGATAADPPWVKFASHWLIGLLIVGIGLFPLLFVKPLLAWLGPGFGIVLPPDTLFLQHLDTISLAGGILLLSTLGIWVIRYLVTRSRPSATGPTWACGYTAGSSKMQYTATSYARSVADLAGPIVNVKEDYPPIKEADVFPPGRAYASHAKEKLEIYLVNRPFLSMRRLLRRIAFLQTGQIRHYILYPFLFILLIFILTALHLI